MSLNEQLNEWLIQLSDMVGGNLNSNSGLDESLEWFTDLSDGELDAIWQLGDKNPSIEKFLKLGRDLLDEVGS